MVMTENSTRVHMLKSGMLADKFIIILLAVIIAVAISILTYYLSHNNCEAVTLVQMRTQPITGIPLP